MRTLLALQVSLLVCVLPAARAGDAVFERPLVELLPMDDIVADGARAYDLEFLALDVDGTPLTGLVVKPSSRGGTLGAATEVAPGHYRIPWTPAAATAARTFPIAFRGKTAAGVRFNRTWDVAVGPPPGFALSLEVSPKELVLGTGVGTGTLTVGLTSPSPSLLDRAELQFVASTGEVRDVVSLGSGKWSARYLPPGFTEPAAAPAASGTGTPATGGPTTGAATTGAATTGAATTGAATTGAATTGAATTGAATTGAATTGAATTGATNAPPPTATPPTATPPTATPAPTTTAPPTSTPAPAAASVAPSTPAPSTPAPVAKAGTKTTEEAPPVPPPDNAIIVVSERSSPLLTYGAVSVPLVARMDVPVKAKKSAKVTLDVAGQTYGPVDTDKRGQATLPGVMIPPGTLKATLTTVVGEEKAAAEMPLDLAPSRRAWILITPASLPADPALVLPLRVFVVTPDGKPSENAQVVARVSAGQVARPVHEGGGLYRVDFIPPVTGPDVTATFEVFVDDALMAGAPADSRTLQLVGTRPTEVRLDNHFGANPDAPLTLSCRVAAGGVGLDGRSVRFVASGASRVGDVRDLGGGNYEADFKPTGSSDLLVDVVTLPRAGANAVRDILVLADRSRTTNDALDTVPLTVLALDEYGYPVQGTEVGLDVIGGGRVSAAKVTTDSSGMALLSFTPSKVAGLAQVRATAAGDTSTVAILQIPAEAGEGLVGVPDSGTPEDRALRVTWGGLRAAKRIAR